MTATILQTAGVKEYDGIALAAAVTADPDLKLGILVG